MDLILPPVGIRTLDPYLLYLLGFKYTRLNDEDAGDICFYNFHKSLSKLYNVCPQADCFGEREFQELTVNLRKWVRKRTCVSKQQFP